MREAVVIVLLGDDGRVLVIQRAAGVPRPGVWSPPTGRVEPGESLAQAVHREAREELGIAIEAPSRLWESRTDDGRYRLHWFVARPVPGQVFAPAPAEVAAVRWIDAAGFTDLQPHFPQHAPFFARVLPDWLRRRAQAGDS